MCRELLKNFKKRELKSLGHQVQNSLYKSFQKKWLDLITESVLSKVYQKSNEQIKKHQHILHLFINIKLTLTITALMGLA